MSLTIGDHEFEHVSYDEAADVLYLRNEVAAEETKSYGTPEGHAVRVTKGGGVAGITIVNARWLIEQSGEILISFPQQLVEISARDLSAAFAQALDR